MYFKEYDCFMSTRVSFIIKKRARMLLNLKACDYLKYNKNVFISQRLLLFIIIRMSFII